MSYPTICRNQVDAMNIHWAQWSLDTFFDYEASLGITGIELWGAMPHVWLDSMGYYDAKKIRKKAEDRGLNINVFCPENVISPYQVNPQEPMYVDLIHHYFENGIKFATEVGAKYLSINSGWGYWNEDRQEAWKRSREMLRDLAEVAEHEGITLTLESLRPQESQLVVTLEDTKRMFDEVNSPNFKVMVDTVAMSVSNESLDQWFETFGADICNMHFIDCNPYGHLIWGDGDRDLGSWVATLNKYHYEGFLGQEITEERYLLDPQAADLRNFHNLERYFNEEI
jgi:protein FrlC